MNEPGSPRKVWPQPAGMDEPIPECRNCGCRHFIPDRVRTVNQMIVRTCHCRHCGKQITLRLPATGDS